MPTIACHYQLAEVVTPTTGASPVTVFDPDRWSVVVNGLVGGLVVGLVWVWLIRCVTT